MNRLLFDTRLKYRLTRHLVLFFSMVLLFALILFYQGSFARFGSSLRVTFINSFFFFGYAYIVLFFLIPKLLLKKRIAWFLLSFLLAGILLSSVKLMVSNELYYASISPENFNADRMNVLRFMLVNTKDMTFIVALFCVAKFTKDYLYTENQRKKLEIQNCEARQRLLQSQLNPHFLFNTINNLYALSLLEPDKTAEITERVQMVLRYIVEQSRHNFVKLTDEVVLVENFISLEKIRYGKRLKVNVLRNGDLDAWLVPPMVLYFLAENCIKHGSSPDSGAPWVNISIDAQPAKLSLTASNSKPSVVSKSSGTVYSGKGLKNLRKRLEILYSENGYSFQINEDEKKFNVVIELKKGKNGVGHKAYR